MLSDNIENLQLDYNSHSNATGNTLNNSIQGSNYDNIIDGGGGGQDIMSGLDGNDTYYVDNALDLIIDGANHGNDTVFATVDYALSFDELETLSLAVGNAVYGTGNFYGNTIYGNSNDNVLDGGGGADALSGLGGNDTFVFHAGQANGDSVYEFEGNGAAAGDVLQFVGYGTIAQGATFHQLTATAWEIGSADGTIHDVITLVGGPAVHATDFIFV